MRCPNFTHHAHVLRDFAVDHQPHGPGPSPNTAFRLQRDGAGYATRPSPPSTVDRTLTIKVSLINPSLRSHRMKGARTRLVPPLLRAPAGRLVPSGKLDSAQENLSGFLFDDAD